MFDKQEMRFWRYVIMTVTICITALALGMSFNYYYWRNQIFVNGYEEVAYVGSHVAKVHASVAS